MKRILVQLDPDAHPSCFDAVVAIDAGVDQLLQYRSVRPEDVTGIVHGTMFTRWVEDLRNTAIFIGGGDVGRGEALLERVRQTFFGPLRVSVMLDANGCNTTAAAAVLAAEEQLDTARATALVLGGTGPVGQRVARLLARQGAAVRLASRAKSRAEEAAVAINQRLAKSPGEVAPGKVTPWRADDGASLSEALRGADLVVAAGAAGVCLLPLEARRQAKSVRVAIDLNAVPPAGIEGIEAADRGVARDGVACYGPIGVGGTKMRIHRAAVARLFESSDQCLDAEEILALGRKLRTKPG